MASNFADNDRPDWLREHNDDAGRLIEGPTSQWLFETLSGETRTVDESLIHLRESANEVRAFRQVGTVFCAPCFLSGRAWFVAIQNGQHPGPRFETGAIEIKEAGLFVAGHHAALAPAEFERIKRIIRRRPSHVEDYFELLAEANRSASKRSPVISPECQTTHFSAGDSFTTRIETWGRKPPVELIAARMLLLGFNPLPFMSSMMRDLHGPRDERGNAPSS